VLAKEVPSSDKILACPYSFLPTELYNPKAFIAHAASLRQAFAHCARFPTAASRRSLDRVSVPVWLFILSDQLPVLALVGRYLTNKLMGRRLILKRERPWSGPLWPQPQERSWSHAVLAPLSEGYPPLEGRLPTCYSPVRRFTGAEALSCSTCMC
jgi:hypothetical protein